MNDHAGKMSVRFLPSVDELLRSPEAERLLGDVRTERSLRLARAAIEKLREGILSDRPDEAPTDRADGIRMAAEALGKELAERDRLRIRRVINATGVILHTNLGRAPLMSAAIDAIAEAAGYCTLEYDVTDGVRGTRAGGAESLFCELTGAEAAVIVNNGAAAAFLVLSTFCNGREVIVSRGELVEIGGDFRIPDVLSSSGATLREVGTTNRTKAADYETAIGPATAMILKVHPSNFRVTGFTKAASTAELKPIAASAGVILFEDVGSGALVPLGEYGLADEPVISEAVKHADLVSFSGDKLLGGVQAGIVVGRAELIEKLKKHPLYRTLRPDKLTIAVLEATLTAYIDETAFENIPTLRMLKEPVEEIRLRSEKVIAATTRDAGLKLEIVDGESVVGGGSAPGLTIPGVQIAVSSDRFSAAEIDRRLRGMDPPVIGRVAKGRVLIDLRTVLAAEDQLITGALNSLVG